MTKNHRSIDKVRASRDGHEFHEAWAARKALQLLLPTNTLVGIAVEGLSPSDQARASAKTVEIADLVLYYGKFPTFDRSQNVVVLQFKYSVGASNEAFRHSDARKTIQKFAAAFRNYKTIHGKAEVHDKLEFELITNRPIYPELHEALRRIAHREPMGGEVRRQASQFKSACGFSGDELVEFAAKVSIIGMAGSLNRNKRDLSQVLVDWSAAPDAMARVRLGEIRQLVRDKAGSAGGNRNVIERTDVLDALGIQEEKDLFPCPDSFPVVGNVVKREQLSEVVERIPKLQKPFLIHASGGVGKTVFLQSLSKALAETHEVVLFDCFGGGAYRAPGDSRHLPKRGLVHIVNNLACRGLCDPLLPGNSETEDLIEAFRRRLGAVVNTLRQGSPKKQLLLFIDAIDNAAEHAREKGEPCFPKLLLESFQYSGRIEGVQLIVSCRTERISLSKGDVSCEEYKLEPFVLEETRSYLKQNIKAVTDIEIQVAQARSGGNPRILEHLASSDRGLLDVSEIENVIELDSLLNLRISGALQTARERGYKDSEINAFLAGLCVLPPPVPLSEYADAHGLDFSAIESFAADLAPLLERTNHGLMFRDEPTETLMRKKYAEDVNALRRVAENLLAKQDRSVYAARALPGLLQKLDDGKRLFELAFDERFPEVVTSTVGREAIRYARLKAAVLHAAQNREYDRLVHLLSELSTIAAVNQRGTLYVLENPDLVVAVQDVDATRRLFETRTAWPGTRHARLAIANLLSGQLNDAYRHVIHALQWIQHYSRQDDEYRRDRSGPERLDIAAVPMCFVAQNHIREATSFMRSWKDWYGFEVSQYLFCLLEQLQVNNPGLTSSVEKFLRELASEIGVIAAALSFMELNDRDRRHLLGRLSKACEKAKAVGTNDRYYRERTYKIEDGLLKASGIATSMKLYSDALAISEVASCERPGLWSYVSHFSDRDVFRFICPVAMRAAARGEAITERVILPSELLDLCSAIAPDTKGLELRQALKREIENRSKAQSGAGTGDAPKPISYDFKIRAEQFIDEDLQPLVRITEAFSRVISGPSNKGDNEFHKLVDLWIELRNKAGRYGNPDEGNIFFDRLGRTIVIFTVWTRSDLSRASVELLWKQLKEGVGVPASVLIDLTSVLSNRKHLQDLAGEVAVRAKALIDEEADVTSRAELCAQLARAILPASREEASAYFRAGLEQMDAIGSGDYAFTNELLLFAASTRGVELEARDFHTLTNICELNMPDEEEKFPWRAFGKGLSKTSGCKALSKLGRWDDRSKVSLDYTLLPYLTALIEDGKIEPSIAVALLQLSDPAELYDCDSATFAKAVHERKCANEKGLIAELMLQYQRNNSGIPSAHILERFGPVVQELFGRDARETAYLSQASLHMAGIRDEQNDHANYRGQSDRGFRIEGNRSDAEGLHKLRTIVSRTSPIDEASMSNAIEELTRLSQPHDLKVRFFVPVRDKVRFDDRSQYIRTVSRLKDLNIYLKLDELKECKEKWSNSSAVLNSLYRELAIPLVRMHASEFVSNEYLSSYMAQQVANVCGISMPTLALELVKVYSAPDYHVPASVWMNLASIVCKQASAGEGQVALKRLLNGSAAKLASTVNDGGWKEGLYPPAGETETAAGLIWLRLGSPAASNRWRAAHSVRCLARLGNWSVIDSLVSKMWMRDAGAFQAPELPFFFLHARLWLVIALARIAVESPDAIARYVGALEESLRDCDGSHVLLRHFASEAILKCAKAGSIHLSEDEVNKMQGINVSPFPRLKGKMGPTGFSSGDPQPMPAARSKSEFHLDYDFEKYEVDSLCRVFGRPRSEIEESIGRLANKFDPKVTSMYSDGGRRAARKSYSGMKSDYHLYGQQLAWHCLQITAGQFLTRYAVTDDSYDDNPWPDWLGRHLLTRRDGLWLADGVDVQPLETQLNLLEKGEGELVITGDKRKLLKLVNLDATTLNELVVEGDWQSSDGIRVSISSALVNPAEAKSLARRLANEEPFRSWLPTYEEYSDGDEYQRNTKEPYTPWIVCPSAESKLDEDDPLGSICAVRRPHFTEDINALMSLKTEDPFKRSWSNSRHKIVAHSEAWGPSSRHGRIDTSIGLRLVCAAQLLKQVLLAKDADLVVLVRLERYEEGSHNRASRFSHTTGVVRIKQSLRFEFYEGAVNKLLKTRF